MAPPYPTPQPHPLQFLRGMGRILRAKAMLYFVIQYLTRELTETDISVLCLELIKTFAMSSRDIQSETFIDILCKHDLIARN